MKINHQPTLTEITIASAAAALGNIGFMLLWYWQPITLHRPTLVGHALIGASLSTFLLLFALHHNQRRLT